MRWIGKVPVTSLDGFPNFTKQGIGTDLSQDMTTKTPDVTRPSRLPVQPSGYMLTSRHRREYTCLGEDQCKDNVSISSFVIKFRQTQCHPDTSSRESCGFIRQRFLQLDDLVCVMCYVKIFAHPNATLTPPLEQLWTPAGMNSCLYRLALVARTDCRTQVVDKPPAEARICLFCWRR